ncbi:NB-ARC domain protein [Pelomyxa schiedti]|nr:NB-ARC domain protein [Pelomyxa schiedti]
MGTLGVSVVSARHLVPVNHEGALPFVEIVVHDGNVLIGETKLSSSATTPRWEQEFVYETREKPKAIAFRVWSHVKHKADTPLGSAICDLSTLVDREVSDQLLDLTDVPKGKLHVTIQWVPPELPPTLAEKPCNSLPKTIREEDVSKPTNTLAPTPDAGTSSSNVTSPSTAAPLQVIPERSEQHVSDATKIKMVSSVNELSHILSSGIKETAQVRLEELNKHVKVPTESKSTAASLKGIFDTVKQAAKLLLDTVTGSGRPVIDMPAQALSQRLSRKDPLRRLCIEVINQFALTPVKPQFLIDEVKQLALVDDSEVVQLLLDAFINAVNQDVLINVGMVDAVAFVLSEAKCDLFAEDQMTKVLQVLTSKVAGMHTQSANAERVYCVLQAISNVLRSLWAAGVSQLKVEDKTQMATSLNEIKGCFADYNRKECYVAAAAEVAKQNLLRIEDTSELLDSVVKWVGHGVMVMQGLANLVNQWDISSLVDAAKGVKSSLEETNIQKSWMDQLFLIELDLFKLSRLSSTAQERLLLVDHAAKIFWNTRVHGRNVLTEKPVTTDSSALGPIKDKPTASKIVSDAKKKVSGLANKVSSRVFGEQDFTIGYMNLLDGIVRSKPLLGNLELKKWCIEQMRKVLLGQGPGDETLSSSSADGGLQVLILYRLKEYTKFPEAIKLCAMQQLEDVEQFIVLEEQQLARHLGVDIAVASFQSSGKQFERAIEEAKASRKSQGLLAYIHMRETWVFIDMSGTSSFDFDQPVPAKLRKNLPRNDERIRHLQGTLKANSNIFPAKAIAYISSKLEPFATLLGQIQCERSSESASFQVHPIVELKSILNDSRAEFPEIQADEEDANGELLQKAKKVLQELLRGSVDDQIREFRDKFFSDPNLEQELKLYIETQGKLEVNDPKEKCFDLSSTFYSDFLQLTSTSNGLPGQRPKTLLLLGPGGTGKSIFAKFIAKKLWEQFDKFNIFPIIISLATVKDPKKNLLEKFLLNEGFTFENIEILKIRQQRLLIILDGFDEIKLDPGVNLCKTNNFADWNAQLLITSRAEAVSQDWNKQFTTLKSSTLNAEEVLCWHIEVFDDRKIKEYVANYRHYGGGQAALCADLYEEFEAKLGGIKDLIKTPFVLSIFMEILPSLVEKYQHDEVKQKLEDSVRGAHKHKSARNSYKLTRLELYDRFTEHWFQKEKSKITPERLNDASVACENPGEDNIMFDFQVRGDIARDYRYFSEELAFYMFSHGTSLIRYSPKWTRKDGARVLDMHHQLERFFSCINPAVELVRSGCSFIKQSWSISLLKKSTMTALNALDNPTLTSVNFVFDKRYRQPGLKYLAILFTSLEEVIRRIGRGESPYDACIAEGTKHGIVNIKTVVEDARKCISFPLAALLKLRSCIRKFCSRRETQLCNAFVPPPAAQALNFKPLRAHPEVTAFLTELVLYDDTLPDRHLHFRDALLMFVDKSRNRLLKTERSENSSFATAASNAITVLIQANHNFCECNLQGVQIPDANLSCGFFSAADLSHSDLSGCDMQQTCLQNTNLSQCKMGGVDFGEAEIKFETDVVCYCSFSPKDKLMSVAGEGVVLVDFSGHGEIQFYNLDKAFYGYCFFSPDGKKLCATNNKELVMFDAQSHVQLFKRSFSGILSLPYFSGDSRFLATSSTMAKAVLVYDSDSGSLCFKFPHHAAGQFSLSNKYFVVQTEDSLSCWDTTSWTKVWEGSWKSSIPIMHNVFLDCAVSVNCEEVSLLDFATGKKLQKSVICEAPVCCCTTYGNKLLAMGLQNGTIQIIEMNEVNELKSLFTLHASKIKLPIDLLEFSPNGNFLFSGNLTTLISLQASILSRGYSGDTRNVMSIWDAENGFSLFRDAILFETISPDNRYYAFHSGNCVLLRGINSVKAINKSSIVPAVNLFFRGHFTQDGSLFLDDRNDSFSLWSTSHKEKVHTVRKHNSADCSSVLLSDRVALISHHKVKFWQLDPPWVELACLRTPLKLIRSRSAYSMTKELLASTDMDDGTLTLLSLKDGKCTVTPLPVEFKNTTRVYCDSKFSPCGTLLVWNLKGFETVSLIFDIEAQNTVNCWQSIEHIEFSRDTKALVAFDSRKNIFFINSLAECSLTEPEKSHPLIVPSFVTTAPLPQLSTFAGEDGKLFVLSCGGGLILVFDTQLQRFIADIKLPEHISSVTAWRNLLVVITMSGLCWFKLQLHDGQFTSICERRISSATSCPVMAGGADIHLVQGLTPLNALLLKQRGAKTHVTSDPVTHIGLVHSTKFSFCLEKTIIEVSNYEETFFQPSPERDRAIFQLLSVSSQSEIRYIVATEIKAVLLGKFQKNICELLEQHWPHITAVKKSYLEGCENFRRQAIEILGGSAITNTASPTDILSSTKEKALCEYTKLSSLYLQEVEPCEKTLDVWCQGQQVFCMFVERFFSWNGYTHTLNILANTNKTEPSKPAGILDAIAQITQTPAFILWKNSTPEPTTGTPSGNNSSPRSSPRMLASRATPSPPPASSPAPSSPLASASLSPSPSPSPLSSALTSTPQPATPPPPGAPPAPGPGSLSSAPPPPPLRALTRSGTGSLGTITRRRAQASQEPECLSLVAVHCWGDPTRAKQHVLLLSENGDSHAPLKVLPNKA